MGKLNFEEARLGKKKRRSGAVGGSCPNLKGVREVGFGTVQRAVATCRYGTGSGSDLRALVKPEAR